MAAESLITLEAITKIYPMGDVDVHALRGVSLAVSEGEFARQARPESEAEPTLKRSSP